VVLVICQWDGVNNYLVADITAVLSFEARGWKEGLSKLRSLLIEGGGLRRELC